MTEEALFISDVCDELEGAKKTGLMTVGFNFDGGNHKIEKLGEINKILHKL